MREGAKKKIVYECDTRANAVLQRSVMQVVLDWARGAGVKRDLVQCQKRPSTVSKET